GRLSGGPRASRRSGREGVSSVPVQGRARSTADRNDGRASDLLRNGPPVSPKHPVPNGEAFRLKDASFGAPQVPADAAVDQTAARTQQLHRQSHPSGRPPPVVPPERGRPPD